MPKKCSTRRASAKRKSSRERLGGARCGSAGDIHLLPDVDITTSVELARKLIVSAWPEIVRGLIKKAADGGYQQTRLLMDLCDLTSQDAALASVERKQQLCDVLLEGLGLPSVQVEEKAAGTIAQHKPEKTRTL